MKRTGLALLLLSATLLRPAPAADPVPATIRVDATQVANTVTPQMYGSCIEDVNHEIYGGLYDQKLFGESFEEPPPPDRITGWTAFGGDWQGSGDICRVHGSAGAKLVWGGPAAGFDDGTVETQVRFADRSGDNAGLLVRVASPGVGADAFDGYEISLSPARQTVLLGKHLHDWHLLKEVAAPVSVGASWNRLRVALDGPRLRVYVNDATAPAIDYTDTDAPRLSGNVALRTWNADAEFRGVSLQPARQIASAGAVLASFPTVPASQVSGMWDAIHTGDASAHFARTNDHSFNGVFSQKIERGPGDGLVGVANRGLNRWGIAVGVGQTFAGHVYLRGAETSDYVTVALESADGSRTYASQKIGHITGDWAKHLFTLTANAADPNARFTITLDHRGTVWVDQAVLMGTGTEQFHGLPIRADIAQSLVAEGVTFLRYGGTMVNAPGYRWKKMIGDRDKRPPYRGHWYPDSTNGFGIFDFLNFCEAAKIRSAFAINIEEGDQDAADLADYLTASATTNPWGRKRAADGHPAPYHLDYLEIGNEEVIGDGHDTAAYQHYADRFRALAKAVHGRNPAIKLVCAAWWIPDAAGMKPVFDAIDGQATAWDLHVDADDPRDAANTDRRLTRMQARFHEWNPKTTLKCVIFEENGNRHDLQRALGHAATMGVTARHGDFVLADCPANCLQPDGQNDNGWDQGQIFFTPSRVWAMPPYYAQQMASRTRLPLRVKSAVSGDTSGDLDITALRSDDGKTLVLRVVNMGASAHATQIALAGFAGCRPTAEQSVLRGDPRAVNPSDGPETVVPHDSTIAASGDAPSAATFPAHSFTVLRFSR